MVQEMLLTAMKNCNCSSVCESDDAKRSPHSSDEFFGYEEAPNDNVSSDNGSKDEMELLHYLGDNRTSISSLEDYPRIRRVFMKYNTPLPSSAPVERLFSFAGHIFAPKRGKMSDKMFEGLIFLKGNSSYMNL